VTLNRFGCEVAVIKDADPGLTARQQQMLLEVYESLRKETAQAAAAGAEQGTEDRPSADEPPPNGPSPAGSG
jgi:hypothetical protein